MSEEGLYLHDFGVTRQLKDLLDGEGKLTEYNQRIFVKNIRVLYKGILENLNKGERKDSSMVLKKGLKNYYLTEEWQDIIGENLEEMKLLVVVADTIVDAQVVLGVKRKDQFLNTVTLRESELLDKFRYDIVKAMLGKNDFEVLPIVETIEVKDDVDPKMN